MKKEHWNEVDGIYKNIENETNQFSIKLAEFVNNSTNEIYKNLLKDIETLQEQLEEYVKEVENELSPVSGSISKMEGTSSDITNYVDSLRKYVECSGISNLEGISKPTDEINAGLAGAINSIITGTSSALEKLSNISSIDTHGYKYKKEIKDSLSIRLSYEGNFSNAVLTGCDQGAIGTNVLGDSTAVQNHVKIDDRNGFYGIHTFGNENNPINADIRIPAIPFKSIELNAENSKIRVKNINCSQLTTKLNGSKISLALSSCSAIEMHSTGGEIELSRVNCGKIYMDANNTQVWMNESKADSCAMLLEMCNANIELPSKINSDHELNINSRYGAIDIDLHLIEGIYYYLEVTCKGGDISCDLPDMSLLSDVKDKDVRHVIYNAGDNKKTSLHVNITVSLCCGSARIRSGS